MFCVTCVQVEMAAHRQVEPSTSCICHLTNELEYYPRSKFTLGQQIWCSRIWRRRWGLAAQRIYLETAFPDPGSGAACVFCIAPGTTRAFAYR